MTTPPANLNPVSANPTHAAKGKSQESASDSPFSQVLSSEIAQNRQSDRPDATDKTAGRPDANDKTAGRQDDTTEPTDSSLATPEAVDKPGATVLAAAYDLLRADTQKTPSDPALALSIPLGLAPVPLQTADDTGAEDSLASAEDGDARQAPRKNPLSRALQAAQTEQTTRAGKPDQEKSTQSVSAFAGQLAATQSDTAKNGDQLSGLIAQSALKTLTQAAAESGPVQSTHLSSRLAPSVGTEAWGQALGDKLVWMAAGAQQTASITLNPPNLGPMQIVLNISNEQATANFFSAQPEVRQALEAAFPRLREMMNEAGIQLGQASVSADTPQQQAFDTPTPRNLPAFGLTDDARPLDSGVAQLSPQRSGRGLVDTFA